MNPFSFLIEIMPYVVPIAIVGIVFSSITAIVKSRHDKRAKEAGSLNDEEARIMQEIHQSLSKMEKRIDALETIIINRK